jgi:putative nucleotidyltransferase with HDIG domain
MVRALAQLLDSTGFMPHGHCFLWTPSLLWSYVAADLIIAASYYSIPFTLWYLANKREDLPYRQAFFLFGAFVMACGTTHLLAVVNIWQSYYWTDVSIKMFTALISALTAITLWRLIPQALAIPSRLELIRLNQELQNEVARRQQAEEDLHAINQQLETLVTERTEKVLAYVEELKTTLNGTIRVVETISELRDPYTAGHERRVGQIAVALARELGLDANQQEGVRVAGNLHDVGKIMIPAEILSKPSKLNPIEYALVQEHVKAGYEILKNVKFPWPVALMVLQHHERMNGSGYPQGLKGDDILIEARIIAVADVIEAMSSHRPYRPGLALEAALGEIERNRDVKYDSKVVDACLKLFREQRAGPFGLNTGTDFLSGIPDSFMLPV